MSEGIGGQKGTRSAPTVLNAMFSPLQFWDGRAKSLEDQAQLPITNPIEMGMPSNEAVITKVLSLPDYAGKFEEVFGGPATMDRLAKAIAAFERTQLSGNSPFDRFFAGDTSAMSPSAQLGWDLYVGKARCQICHTYVPETSPFFSDFQFHNIGIGAKRLKEFDELAGRIKKIAGINALTQEQIDTLALADEQASELGRFLLTRQQKTLGSI